MSKARRRSPTRWSRKSRGSRAARSRACTTWAAVRRGRSARSRRSCRSGATTRHPRGVSVEVGERQAAVDLDVVVEYGAAIVDVAESIRRNVISQVEAMTGLEVTEVNVTVDDVYLGEADSDEEPRVQ